MDLPSKVDASGAPASASDFGGHPLPNGIRVVERLSDTLEGRVYSATYPSGQEVAVLIPRAQGERTASGAPELVGRLRQRVWQDRMRKVTHLRHPNVTEVYEAGETADGVPYIVLERPSGELLSAVLARRGRLSESEAVELCRQAAAGLEAAHASGIVHGNVSPQTMRMEAGKDGSAHLKLTGWSMGPFRVASPPGQGAGVAFASPEQHCGVAAEAPSDVYSLGAVLHQVLSGSPPESGAVAASIPRLARAVLARALDPVPGRRFPSAVAFAHALERAVGGAPEHDMPEVGRALIAKTGAAATSVARSVLVSLRWARAAAGGRSDRSSGEAGRCWCEPSRRQAPPWGPDYRESVASLLAPSLR